MDNNLRLSGEVLKVLFNKISVSNILRNSHYNIVNNEYLIRILRTEFPQYHYSELFCYINAFSDSLTFSSNNYYQEEKNEINVFKILFYIAKRIIITMDYKFFFDYQYSDIWRNLTLKVDEEFLVTSAVVQNDIERNINRSKFEWDFCISHNNTQLNSILNRENGLSENHFHLRGSSPYFYVSWIFMMNNLNNLKYKRYLNLIEENRLNEQVYISKNDMESSFILLYYKASSIRLYLYSLIAKVPIQFGNYYISSSKLFHDISEYYYDTEIQNKLNCLMKKISNEDNINQVDFQQRFPSILLKETLNIYSTNKNLYEKYIEYCNSKSYLYLKSLLQYSNEELFPIYIIQDVINGLRFCHTNSNNIDYAQGFQGNIQSKYAELSGERFIIYNSLKEVYNHNIIVSSLLYVYLLIKNKIRSELVQCNPLIGFSNFANYQDRKDFFILWSHSSNREEKMLTSATIQSLLSGNSIFRVELRIGPKDNSQDIAKDINLYDSAIESVIKDNFLENKLKKEQFFYTIHFFKRKDTENKKFSYRDGQLRKKILKQANALISLKKNNPQVANRILGIDACSSEMDCRPEVFGVIFRLLQFYNKQNDSLLNQYSSKQIKATYHVGEDNYDILDALRAIDETMSFLELPSSSRLGHATLLGILPDFYYRKKGYFVSMPCQIFLDNIVWLYFFLKYNQADFNEYGLLNQYLEEKFDFYFKKIYSQNININHLSNISKSAYEKYNNTVYRDEFSKNHYEFNIYRYYGSWLLRGDDPELYQDGYFKMPSVFEKFKISTINEKTNNSRYNMESSYLYYLYHYNNNVRKIGNQPITEEIPKYLIKGITITQELLKQKIINKRISIETNPSSNLLISPIEQYSDHPIINFYNKDFSNNSTQLQLNVSINTDDKGVFSTCLSNEYAYLLFYLQQKKDTNDNLIYNSHEIYNWIDSIRRMGNEQSFGSDIKV